MRTRNAPLLYPRSLGAARIFLTVAFALLGLAGMTAGAAARSAAAHRPARKTRRLHRIRRPAPLACLHRSPVPGGSGASAAAVAAAARVSHVANPLRGGLAGIASPGGMQNDSTAQIRQDVKLAQGAGASWLRVTINWATIQNHGPRAYEWAPVDRIVRQAHACRLNVLGTLDYTPSWARPAGTPGDWRPDPQLFARFAERAARHYAGLGVHAFEIWNEPNLTDAWAPAPDPAGYTRVLQAVYPAIKTGDPRSTVITGGLSPAPSDGHNVSPYDFINGIYSAGGKGFFDAVGDHPFTFPGFPGQRQDWNPWFQMVGARHSIRNAMIAHGDGAKRVWATEFGAATGGPAGRYVSEGRQASIITRGLALWASYSWGGPIFVYSGRDGGEQAGTWESFMGIVRQDFSPKPGYFAFRGFITTLRARLLHDRGLAVR